MLPKSSKSNILRSLYVNAYTILLYIYTCTTSLYITRMWHAGHQNPTVEQGNPCSVDILLRVCHKTSIATATCSGINAKSFLETRWILMDSSLEEPMVYHVFFVGWRYFPSTKRLSYTRKISVRGIFEKVRQNMLSFLDMSIHRLFTSISLVS